MINKETILKVADNTGAKLVRCIGHYGNRKYSTIGDIIIVSVKANAPKSTIKRKSLQRALIIRTKSGFNRNGYHFSFADNAVVLIDKKNTPLGNRIFGATVREIKQISSGVLSLIEEIY